MPSEATTAIRADLDRRTFEQIAHWRAWSLEPEAIYLGCRDWATLKASHHPGDSKLEFYAGKPPTYFGLPCFEVMEGNHLKVAPKMPKV